MVVVLVVAAGAGWESHALACLGERAGIVVLRRCVDVDDLMGAASAGQADVAVVAIDAPGLDLAAVDHLRAQGVRLVAVVPGGPAGDPASLRATRIGVRALVTEDDLGTLPDLVAAERPVEDGLREQTSEQPEETRAAMGRVIAVWGPAGAPGRTTVACGVAAELASRSARTLLVDADPHGGSVAQQLGILDDVSGLLGAARLTAGGMLAERFDSVQRSLGQHLAVVTGLPRADRWLEVRTGVVEHLTAIGRTQGHVVVDTGFSLEQDPALDAVGRPGRNQLTRAAIGLADEVVVVGGADPVGLSRLARGLVELRDVVAGAPVRVVVNRMRPTLGWSEKDIAGMVEGFTRLTGLHFSPEDRAVVDRALVAGRTVIEMGESMIGRALSGVVDGLVPETCAV